MAQFETQKGPGGGRDKTFRIGAERWMARIGRESLQNRDKLMLISYLMFLRKDHPELAFAAVTHRGHTARLGEDRPGLLYLEREVAAGLKPVRYTVTAYPVKGGPPQSSLDVSKQGVSLRVGGRAEVRVEEEAPGESMGVRLGFVSEAATILAPVAAAKRIRLEPPSDDEPVSVYAPEEALRQVVMNLVSNALKYTPEDGKVSLGLQDSEHEVKFWVSDTGPGIPQEDIPHLFTRFYRSQEDRSEARRIRGTGLGLSIAHRAVTAMGGRIHVLSKEGEGTTFLVTIPKTSAQGHPGTRATVEERSGGGYETHKQSTLTQIRKVVVDPRYKVKAHA